MDSTFAITACGRSGTRFLARELGRSKTYDVQHEPNTDILTAEERFRGRSYYGEVNSFLLTRFNRLRVSRRLVILRNPYDIFYSYIRLGRTADIDAYILSAICLLDAYIQEGVSFIRFQDFTTRLWYIPLVAKYVGIRDLKVGDVSLEPINSSPITEADFRGLVKPYVSREFDAFNKKYFPEAQNEQDSRPSHTP